ncbi:prepilin peptidase [Chloroflexota bacterium]
MWIPVLAFILGTSFGSFLNVVIDRLPRGQSLVYPPSHCGTCGKKLGVFELIPIASYLWLKGRCRYCKASIPRRILAVEMGSGLLFALISFNYGFSIEFLVLAFYTCIFIILTLIDLEHGLILNKITYPAIGISFALAPFWSSLGFSRTFLGGNSVLHVFLSSLSGGVIFAGFFLIIILLSRGGMGWGDVKMAWLIGLVTGFPSVLVAMMVSFISGGLTAGLLLLLHLKSRKETIPYGPFLAIGAFIALLWGENIIDWYWRQWL